jgi:hypothetical protein
MRALIIDPTRHAHMAIRRSQVRKFRLWIMSDNSAGLLKIDVVRKATNAPSSVRMIWAFESAFLYQSRTFAKRRFE